MIRYPPLTVFGMVLIADNSAPKPLSLFAIIYLYLLVTAALFGFVLEIFRICSKCHWKVSGPNLRYDLCVGKDATALKRKQQAIEAGKRSMVLAAFGGDNVTGPSDGFSTFGTKHSWRLAVRLPNLSSRSRSLNRKFGLAKDQQTVWIICNTFHLDDKPWSKRRHTGSASGRCAGGLGRCHACAFVRCSCTELGCVSSGQPLGMNLPTQPGGCKYGENMAKDLIYMILYVFWTDCNIIVNKFKQPLLWIYRSSVKQCWVDCGHTIVWSSSCMLDKVGSCMYLVVFFFFFRKPKTICQCWHVVYRLWFVAPMCWCPRLLFLEQIVSSRSFGLAVQAFVRVKMKQQLNESSKQSRLGPKPKTFKFQTSWCNIQAKIHWTPHIFLFLWGWSTVTTYQYMLTN